MPNNQSLKKLDILEAMGRESPQLYAKLSQKRYAPIIWLLKEIIGERRLKAELHRLQLQQIGPPPLSPLDNLSKFLYQDKKISVTVTGEDNLVAGMGDCGPIIVANHTLGILDGLTLVEVISRRLSHAYILANRLVMLTEVFNPFFIPVGVFTRTNTDEWDHIDQLYRSKAPIALFPSGLTARKDKKGTLHELPWKKHFLQKAIEYKRNIIPTYMDNENSALFYRIHRIRTRMRLKINLEMFLLLREAINYHHKTMRISFAPPISYQQISSYINDHPSKNKVLALNELTEKIRTYVCYQFTRPLDLHVFQPPALAQINH